jgi:hypothetical protein
MAGFTKKTETNTEFAKGGKTHMFGEQAAADMPSGTTDKGDKGGPGDKFAKGGSGKMFGYSGAVPARSGITSAR